MKERTVGQSYTLRWGFELGLLHIRSQSLCRATRHTERSCGKSATFSFLLRSCENTYTFNPLLQHKIRYPVQKDTRQPSDLFYMISEGYARLTLFTPDVNYSKSIEDEKWEILQADHSLGVFTRSHVWFCEKLESQYHSQCHTLLPPFFKGTINERKSFSMIQKPNYGQ